MHLINEENRPTGGTVVTIGSFDGVHRGHQALIQRAQELAEASHLDMVVLTFDPHPKAILGQPSGRYLISPLPLKLAYLEQYGVPWVKVLPFTRELAMTPPFPFLELEIGQALHARAVVVGYNFTFGAGGTGNADTIRVWGGVGGVDVSVVDPVRLAGDVPASSSLIRARLTAGDIGSAREALGHPYTVSGTVVAGAGRGRELGYPTANLVPPDDQVMPPYGVYVGYLRHLSERYPAVANWGIRPTFGETRPVLEVHAMDTAGLQLAGQTIQFDIWERIRDERRFDAIDALRRQIAEDLATARHYLKQQSPSAG